MTPSLNLSTNTMAILTQNPNLNTMPTLQHLYHAPTTPTQTLTQQTRQPPQITFPPTPHQPSAHPTFHTIRFSTHTRPPHLLYLMLTTSTAMTYKSQNHPTAPDFSRKMSIMSVPTTQMTNCACTLETNNDSRLTSLWTNRTQTRHTPIPSAPSLP